jgi:DNA repair protein RAD16
LRHYNWLNRYVLNPIKQWGYAAQGKDAMDILRKQVLGSLLLRRTKQGRAADLALPGRLITLREVRLHGTLFID